jgi:carbonic anhydrase
LTVNGLATENQVHKTEFKSETRAMEKLIRGIVDFRDRLLPQYVDRFKELSSRQTPDTLFISCSDSRVVPDLLVSTDPGDLFVMRNVGNLVPPSTVMGDSIGDVSEASAIEYAILVLGVSSIIVCGHSECGAMKAALTSSTPSEAPNLEKWLHHATSAVFRLDQEGPLDKRWEPHNQLSQLNVLIQLEHLNTYPIVADRVKEGTLRICGWWFEISTGGMFSYNKGRRRFEAITDKSAERIISQMKTKPKSPPKPGSH